MILGQVAAATKSNQITAIDKLLDLLILKSGNVVTINEYHWDLDVALKEDDSSITGQANQNLRIARNFALKLLKGEISFKSSLVGKMRKCHCSDAYLTKVLVSGKL